MTATLVIGAVVFGAVWLTRRTLWRWWWDFRVEMQLPYTLGEAAQALINANTSISRSALHALMKDYRKLRASGASDDDYSRVGVRWEQVAKRLHSEQFDGELQVDRFKAVMDSLADLDRVDETKRDADS